MRNRRVSSPIGLVPIIDVFGLRTKTGQVRVGMSLLHGIVEKSKAVIVESIRQVRSDEFGYLKHVELGQIFFPALLEPLLDRRNG